VIERVYRAIPRRYTTRLKCLLQFNQTEQDGQEKITRVKERDKKDADMRTGRWMGVIPGIAEGGQGGGSCCGDPRLENRSWV
jgi:hypothetical protein